MGKISRIRHFLKDESGAALVVEATLVFPMVFAVIAVLLFMGFYLLQRAMLYQTAQKMAVYASYVVAYPGYEILAGVPDTSASMIASGSNPSVKTIEQTMDEHDPYRYMAFKLKEEATLERYLDEMVQQYWMLEMQHLHCDVSYENQVITQKIKVRITGSITMPAMVKLLGVESIMDLDVVAYAASSDPVEFVRNTDMVFDLTDYILEKFKIKEKISGVFSRITDVMKKLG